MSSGSRASVVGCSYRLVPCPLPATRGELDGEGCAAEKRKPRQTLPARSGYGQVKAALRAGHAPGHEARYRYRREVRTGHRGRGMRQGRLARCACAARPSFSSNVASGAFNSAASHK